MEETEELSHQRAEREVGPLYVIWSIYTAAHQRTEFSVRVCRSSSVLTRFWRRRKESLRRWSWSWRQSRSKSNCKNSRINQQLWEGCLSVYGLCICWQRSRWHRTVPEKCWAWKRRAEKFNRYPAGIHRGIKTSLIWHKKLLMPLLSNCISSPSKTFWP